MLGINEFAQCSNNGCSNVQDWLSCIYIILDILSKTLLQIVVLLQIDPPTLVSTCACNADFCKLTLHVNPYHEQMNHNTTMDPKGPYVGQVFFEQPIHADVPN